MEMANQKSGYANPIRELLQNSLDASREAGNSTCEINIYIETIKKSDIPNIEKYEQTLESSIEMLKERDGYSAGNRQAIEAIKESLKKESVTVLMFVDNGTGMQKKKLENLLDEISSHADDSSGGSYGVGSLSSYYLSSLRYVLYATKFWSNQEKTEINTLFTGSTILAGHKSGNAQRGGKGRIVEHTPDNQEDPEFSYPTKFPNFIKSKMADLNSTGSMVAILGLNEDWNFEAKYAIASNFFHSIAHNGLNINVHQNQQSTKITGSEIEELLVSKKTGQQARDAILSGQATYQAYQAIKEDKSQKTIELSNGDKVYVYIKKVETESSICLVRNGMLIARHDKMLSKYINNLRKNSNYEPFVAVIDVDKDDSKALFRLVRNAENMHHNELKEKKESNKKDIQKLKELFKELSEKIKEHLTEIKRDSFDLPFFEMPNKAKTKGNNPKQSGQSTHAKIKKINPPRPPKNCPICGKNPCICPCPKCNERPCICRNPPPKPKKKPDISLQSLDSSNAMRYIDKGTEFEIRIRVNSAKLDSKYKIYFSIALAEDNDNNTRNDYVEFISLSINNDEVSKNNFIRDNRQVILGKFNDEKTYNIIARVKKPDGFDNIKMALEPIFGLKQHNSKE